MLCAMAPSVSKALISVAALSSLAQHRAHAEPESRVPDDSDIFKMLSKRAREAMDSFSADSAALDVDPRGLFEAATRRAHDMVAQVWIRLPVVNR